MAKKIIITIGREFGTGGRKIAMELGQRLGINVYDKRLLDSVKEHYNLTTEQMDKIRAKKKSWWTDFKSFYQQAATLSAVPYNEAVYVPEVNSELIYKEESEILRTLAEQESCIILGRTGFHIFRDEPNAYRIFLMADMPYRRDKVARRLNINEGSADALIKKIDEDRENYTKAFSGVSRYDAHNYDLCLNVTGLDPVHVADFITALVKERFAL